MSLPTSQKVSETMKIKLIIVGTKYQMNAGYIARIAGNFGIGRLFFVKPRADIRGKKAIMFSKHSAGLLRTAKIYGSLGEALMDCDLAVGTSGVWRTGDRVSEHEYTLEAAIGKVGTDLPGKASIGLVLGRDDIGLSHEEVEMCDMLLHIPANPEYPVLNISHALAIILYAFSSKGADGYKRANPERPSEAEVSVLLKSFGRMASKKKIRNKKAVANIFSKMVRRARLNKNELHALITAVK